MHGQWDRSELGSVSVQNLGADDVACAEADSAGGGGDDGADGKRLLAVQESFIDKVGKETPVACPANSIF
jgi:hypothetical protein